MYDTYVIPQQKTGNPVELLQDWTWIHYNWIYDPMEDWVKNHSKLWFEDWGDRPKRVCVQAGGAFGLYPRMLAEQFELVYTFEPIPDAFHCLVNNCQQDNIFKFNAALGDKPQLITFKVVPFCMPISHVENSGVPQDAETSKLIQQMTIDSLALKHCDLIALDVEGYELQVLKGAEQTIKQHWPRIITEVNRDVDANPLMDWLKNLDYNIVTFSGMDIVWEHDYQQVYPW